MRIIAIMELLSCKMVSPIEAFNMLCFLIDMGDNGDATVIAVSLFD